MDDQTPTAASEGDRGLFPDIHSIPGSYAIVGAVGSMAAFPVAQAVANDSGREEPGSGKWSNRVAMGVVVAIFLAVFVSYTIEVA